MESCIRILPRKGQLLPSTGPAGLPHPLFPGHPGVSHCSLSQAALRLEASGALSEAAPGSPRPSSSWERVEEAPQSLFLSGARPSKSSRWGISTAAPSPGPGLMWSLQMQRIPPGPALVRRDKEGVTASPLVRSCSLTSVGGASSIQRPDRRTRGALHRTTGR